MFFIQCTSCVLMVSSGSMPDPTTNAFLRRWETFHYSGVRRRSNFGRTSFGTRGAGIAGAGGGCCRAAVGMPCRMGRQEAAGFGSRRRPLRHRLSCWGSPQYGSFHFSCRHSVYSLYGGDTLSFITENTLFFPKRLYSR